MKLADQVASHYNDLDPFYRFIWGEHVHHGLWLSGKESPNEAVEQLIHLLIAYGRIEPSSTVLDVGSGYGGTARLLADQLSADVTAVTLSERQHEFATAHPTPVRGSVRYYLRDFFEMEFSTKFDNVVAIESLAHFEDPASFFSRAASMLRPGGRLIICAWLSAEKPSAWHKRYLLEPIIKEGRLKTLATSTQIASWIDNSGLVPVSFDDFSRHVRHTWTVCIERLLALMATDPQTRRYLLNAENANRSFAVTLARIWLAYRVGALRYGIFVCEKE